MYMSQNALIAIAQIIPILLLATFLDRDVIANAREGSKLKRSIVFSLIILILLGELLAIIAIMTGESRPWSNIVIAVAAGCAVASMANVASWRLFDYDFLTGLPHSLKNRKRR